MLCIPYYEDIEVVIWLVHTDDSTVILLGDLH